jgi:hypothetical protein
MVLPGAMAVQIIEGFAGGLFARKEKIEPALAFF